MQGKSRGRRLLGAPPGHPARGRICCRGRSPGLRVVATVRPSRSRLASVTFVGQRLAVYSCGGSAGIAPASLLAPDQVQPGEPRRARLSAKAPFRQAPRISKHSLHEIAGPCADRTSHNRLDDEGSSNRSWGLIPLGDEGHRCAPIGARPRAASRSRSHRSNSRATPDHKVVFESLLSSACTQFDEIKACSWRQRVDPARSPDQKLRDERQVSVRRHATSNQLSGGAKPQFLFKF